MNFYRITRSRAKVEQKPNTTVADTGVFGEGINDPIGIAVKNLNVSYGGRVALKNINFEMQKNTVTAFIGPSGCGKSTLLKTFNRMNDLVEGCVTDGKVLINGKDIYNEIDVTDLRKNVGMVFQKPNPFAMSIYENVAYGPRIYGIKKKDVLDEFVENALKQAAIFDEVKDQLSKSAFGLSGGQQQRLCIARSLAVRPKILLMDEPTSALDPLSTAKIEELIDELREHLTIIIVTHNMQQAARISSETAFFLSGELIEFDGTDYIFSRPKDKRTENYISGRFG
jgi:phosphate transport system ATP-binding protein